MSQPIDVCVRGAGVVGRTLALLLARERLRVGLVDAGAPPAERPDVRAYALNAASRALLQGLRAWPDAQHVCPVLRMEVRGDQGGAVHFDAAPQGSDALAWIADVPALEARLDEALRFQPLVQRLPGPVRAPLTVISEGRASATREAVGVEFEIASYGQQAIAARVAGGPPHGGVARQWFAGGDVLALLPLADAGNSCALVWSVHDEHAQHLLALDDTAFMAELAQATGQPAGSLRLAAARAAWPLQLARAHRWCGPGWALVGDAAHVLHPLAGQGLNLGLADARELAGTLAGREYWRPLGDERLLRRYERARQLEAGALRWATDGLQLLFARAGGPWPWLRNAGMRGFDASGPVKHWVARQAAGRT